MKPPMTYDFKTQHRIGNSGEDKLDAHFSHWFDITPASDAEQRQGIDRWFVRKETSEDGIAGERFAVEFKTDHIAARTGNAFVETVSVERGHGQKIQGWVFTSRARWLVYYCPGSGAEVIYLFSFAQLRAQIIGWRRSYGEKKVENKGYCSRGIAVPLHEFERYAKAVISL